MAFNLAITSFGQLGRTTNFHILIHMAIGSYHINRTFWLSLALSLILLSKMTKYSPKNRTFLLIKVDRLVTDTFHWYHTDPQASAVPASCLTQKFWISFPRGSQQLWNVGIGLWCDPVKLVPKFMDILPNINKAMEVIIICIGTYFIVYSLYFSYSWSLQFFG